MIDVSLHEGYATIGLNRPEKRNALDVEMREQLRELLRDNEIRDRILLVKSSVPGIFVAGADLNELASRTVPAALARGNAHLFNELEAHPRPTIALVDGPALGGGFELALAADFRIATVRARWGLPEVRLGLVPAAGGLHRLQRVVGWGRATEMVLTGLPVDAQQGQLLGISNRLCEVDDVEEVLAQVVSSLTDPDSLAQQLAKELFRAPRDHGHTADTIAQALLIGSQSTQDRIGMALKRTK